MKLTKGLLGAFLLFTILGQSTHASEVVFFESNSNGELVEKRVEKKILQDSMVRTLTTVNNSVLKSVGEKEFKAGEWQLKMFSVGLGLSGTIGLGPWDLGSTIKQRIFFTK